MDKSISIIIPVYNVEQYLKRCMECLLEQKEFLTEIILIDDGSTDSSSKICLDYSRKYANVIYLRQPNAGPGAARERGLRIASGKYICFVDSDDIVDINVIGKMVNYAEETKADIVSANIAYLDETDSEMLETVSRLRIKPYEIYEVKKHPELIYLLRLFLWGKIYKKSLLINANVTQPNHFYEDTSVLPCIFSTAETVFHVDEVVYKYYRGRVGNTTGNYFRLQDLYLSMTEVMEYFHVNGKFEQYKLSLKILLNSQIRFLYRKLEKGLESQQIGQAYAQDLLEKMYQLMVDNFGSWLDTAKGKIAVAGTQELFEAVNCFCIASNGVFNWKEQVKDNQDLLLIITDNEEISSTEANILYVCYDEVVHEKAKKCDYINFHTKKEEEDRDTYIWNLADELLKAVIDGVNTD